MTTYRAWFYAAAAYNAVWGSAVILFAHTTGWRVVGMFVLVYAPAYFWVARCPERHAHLVLVAMLGKVLGPLGFAFGLAAGALSPAFGLMVLTNDVVWWPAFAGYLRAAARESGGWGPLLAGYGPSSSRYRS